MKEPPSRVPALDAEKAEVLLEIKGIIGNG